LTNHQTSNIKELIPFRLDEEIVFKKENDYVKSKQPQPPQQPQQPQQNRTSKDVKQQQPAPIELYVELLLVTDRSVFEDHKRFARTNDDNLAFLHMRTYFSHFVNGVIRTLWIYKNEYFHDKHSTTCLLEG